MKDLYLRIAVFCFLFASSISQNTYAQCSCSGGTQASSISYEQKLNVTNSASSTISFPQFNPSTGTLGCVLFQDTISGVTNTTIQNSGSTKTLFQFLLTVANTIAGPGVSIVETFNQNYGPDSLAASQSITYGPDSLFKNVRDTSYANDTTGYQGTGTVNYTYTLNGGLTALAGGLNYNAQIITNYWGSFKLTYYYCDPSGNKKHCRNFTATKGNGCVNLNWNCDSSDAHSNCEIDYSKDGNQFNSIGSTHSPQQMLADTAQYHYTYNTTSTDKNKIYFRIKFTDSTGNITYSPVRWVNLSAQGIAGCNVYPNPARSTTVVEFDQMLTGTYLVELVTGTGTTVQRNVMSLSNSNQMTLDVSKLNKGLYFLHIKDQSSSQEIVTRVLVQ